MADSERYNIQALREQIIENVKVAFPHFYERNIDNVSFKIIVQYDTVSYTACVVSGSDNKTFIASVASENLWEAYDNLFRVSGSVLKALKEEGILSDHEKEKNKRVFDNGILVTKAVSKPIWGGSVPITIPTNGRR